VDLVSEGVPPGELARYDAERAEIRARLTECAGNWKRLNGGESNDGTVYFRTDGFADKWTMCVGGTAADPREPYLRLCEDDPATPTLDYSTCVLAAGHRYRSPGSGGGGLDIMEFRREGRAFRDELLRSVEPQEPEIEYGFAEGIVITPMVPDASPTFSDPGRSQEVLVAAFPMFPIGPITGPIEPAAAPVWLQRAVYDCAVGYGLTASGAYAVTRAAQNLALGDLLRRGESPNPAGRVAAELIARGQALGIANMAGIVGCATRTVEPYIPDSKEVVPRP
jgi:hypothetical protein